MSSGSTMLAHWHLSPAGYFICCSSLFCSPRPWCWWSWAHASTGDKLVVSTSQLNTRCWEKCCDAASSMLKNAGACSSNAHRGRSFLWSIKDVRMALTGTFLQIWIFPSPLRCEILWALRFSPASFKCFNPDSIHVAVSLTCQALVSK